MSHDQSHRLPSTEVLVSRYTQDAIRFLVGREVPLSVAQDMVTDFFISFDQNRHLLREEASFPAYLYKALSNQVAGYYRAKGKGNRIFWEVLSDFDNIQEPSSAESPESHYLEKEERDILFRILETLPPSRREVYLLKEFHGLSSKEMAKIMDLSVGAIDKMLYRTRIEIKEKLRYVFQAEQETA